MRAIISILSLLTVVIFQFPTVLCFHISFGRQRSSAHHRHDHFSSSVVTSNALNGIHVEDNKAPTVNSGSQQPANYGLPEIFIPNAFSHQDLSDNEQLWVPQTDTVSFRPLCLSVSGGYYVNLLRVRGSGLLSRHRHPGPVHGYVIKGKWRYLEHDWVANEGSYIFEPPGEIHTLVVPDDVEEMITLFFVTGSLLYCDESGNVVGADDVFTKLDMARKHYASIGLGEEFVKQFVR